MPVMPLLPGKELNRQPAAPVSSYAEIEQDAELMKVRIEQKFDGKYEYGFALAHSQVAKDHKAFFVCHGDLVEKPKGDAGTGWVRSFPHRVIINPVILEKPAVMQKEIAKLDNTMVKAIKNTGALEEGCLSFPYRTAKLTMRYHRIKVRYQTPDGLFGGLKTHTEWLEGLASHVFQHECDHLKGQNIFFA